MHTQLEKLSSWRCIRTAQPQVSQSHARVLPNLHFRRRLNMRHQSVLGNHHHHLSGKSPRSHNLSPFSHRRWPFLNIRTAPLWRRRNPCVPGVTEAAALARSRTTGIPASDQPAVVDPRKRIGNPRIRSNGCIAVDPRKRIGNCRRICLPAFHGVPALQQ
jgi:hypothetical protein